MIASPCSIAWALVCVFWSGVQLVAAAPTSIPISETASSPLSTSTSDPNYTPNPNPYGNYSDDNSSPITTIVIVCAVGGMALAVGCWIGYKRFRRNPQMPTIVMGPNTSPTMVFAPGGSGGEMPPVTAIPSLRYNAPPMSKPVMPCGDVITPPPPAYDVATGGRPGLRDSTSSSVLMASRPGKERSDSRWKDLLSPGRE
ncbi:hypothetical protein BDV93DRAFT_251645 [Ceratobasidium sp. AG-I]|nr:hypothetical protein BDV93DRAFT_251645 [Ceratobasidium sp. AG-I]